MAYIASTEHCFTSLLVLDYLNVNRRAALKHCGSSLTSHHNHAKICTLVCLVIFVSTKLICLDSRGRTVAASYKGTEISSWFRSGSTNYDASLP